MGGVSRVTGLTWTNSHCVNRRFACVAGSIVDFVEPARCCKGVATHRLAERTVALLYYCTAVLSGLDVELFSGCLEAPDTHASFAANLDIHPPFRTVITLTLEPAPRPRSGRKAPRLV